MPTPFDRDAFHIESTTPLGAAGTATGGVYASDGYRRLRASAASDQNGTLYVDQSPDNTNWYNTLSQAVTGDSSTPPKATVLESMVSMAFIRVRYVNGATPQANFLLASAQIAV
jgi:hypothetical protein